MASTEQKEQLANYIPVYVMLPLDTVSSSNELMDKEALKGYLSALKSAQVDGLMIDIWWGLVEGAGPKQYDWSAYRLLFEVIQTYGLKVQAIMSFHQCGGNVGDTVYIPLPEWVIKEGDSNPDIFFTNREALRNKEYLSFGVDDKPVLNGRTAIEVYRDYMKSFTEAMKEFLESGMITEIEVGLGPCGELRYPSYPESHGWTFPGIGQFQCYDKYLLADLKEATKRIGHSEWGHGPEDAGTYNDWPQATGFFCDNGSFTTEYGKFFLEWYSSVLLQHGDKILEAASHVFAGYKVRLAAKVAGIHWWYKTKNHAAELTAGYYNLDDRDGYTVICKMLKRHSAVFDFTCVEMRDEDQTEEYCCGPEELVKQVLDAGRDEGVDVSCENALSIYDQRSYEQILNNARLNGSRRINVFTYLRVADELLEETNLEVFTSFVKEMHAGLDYNPEPEQYYRPRVPLQPSKPLEAFQENVSPSNGVNSGPFSIPNLMGWLSKKMPSSNEPAKKADALSKTINE